MHPLLSRADDFQDLLRLQDHDLPYRFETIFSDESWGRRRASRKKLELLRGIDEELRAMLDEGEEVRFLTVGTSFTFLESYFMGWLLYYFNRRAIVLTDRRILLLQVHGRDRPGVLRSQIRYSAISKVSGRLLGGTALKLRDGKKLLFTGVARKDRKFTQALIQRLHDAGVFEGAPVAGHQHLCPHCHTLAEIGSPACETCEGTFKSPRKAGLLSLLFPGIGDFYMGHRKLAALELAVAGLLWIALFLPDPEYPMTAGGVVLVGALLVGFVHVPDAVATWYLARRGVFPEEEGRRVVGPGPGVAVREPGVGVG